MVRTLVSVSVCFRHIALWGALVKVGPVVVESVYIIRFLVAWHAFFSEIPIIFYIFSI
jgi:hypothetical protein